MSDRRSSRPRPQMGPEREQAFWRARARAAAYSAVSELLLPATDEHVSRLQLGLLERDVAGAEGLGIDPTRLLELLARLGQGGRDEIDALKGQTFGTGSNRLHSPYSTEYGTDKGAQNEQQLADIASYYAVWGVRLANDVGERVDHFGLEADFLAFLSLKEAVALVDAEQAQVDFVRGAARRFAEQYAAGPVRTLVERLDASAPYTPVALFLAGLIDELLPDGVERLSA